MSMEQGDKENFQIRIRPVTGGIEVELEEVINLRGYVDFGKEMWSKKRRTTWCVYKDFTLGEMLSICKDESVFNDNYGQRG